MQEIPYAISTRVSVDGKPAASVGEIVLATADFNLGI